MSGFDGAAFGQQIVAEVKRYMDTSIAPLIKRVEAMEESARAAHEIDFKSLIDASVSTVLPKAINDALAGVDQRVLAVTLERDTVVGLIEQAVGAVHEEVREFASQFAPSSLSQDHAELTAGLEQVIKQIENLNTDTAQFGLRLSNAVNDAFAELHIPVDGIAGKDGRGIKELGISEDGRLLVKYTDDDTLHDLGMVKAADIDLDYVNGVITDQVIRAVAEIPAPIGFSLAAINDDGHLWLKQTDGQAIDVGQVVGKDGTSADPIDYDKVNLTLAELVNSKMDAIEIPTPVGIENVSVAKDGVLWVELTNQKMIELGTVVGKDGTSVELAQIETIIAEKVAAIPVPRDGIDGRGIKGVTIDQTGQLVIQWSSGEVEQLGFVVGESVVIEDIKKLVDEAVASLPAPKDGVDGKDGIGILTAGVNEQGQLYLVYSNSEEPKPIGFVHGKDVDMSEVARMVNDAVSQIPVPKDGVDGVGIESLMIENGSLLLGLSNGETKDLGRVVGQDSDWTEVKRAIFEEIASQLDLIETPKDGRGIVDVRIDDMGILHMSFTDETEKPIGFVKGADADMDELRKLVINEVAALPKPKDGVGIKSAVIDPEGILHLHTTEDQMIEVGKIVGEDGKDAELPVVETMIQEAVAALPVPQDGKSVTVDDIRPILDELVANLPLPKDGADGVGVKTIYIADQHLFVALDNDEDAKDLGQIIHKPLDLEEVAAKAAALIPVPKDGADGIGLAGALINRAGELVVTLTNGQAKELGPVVGKDAVLDIEAVQKMVKQQVDLIPHPRDGVDGVGFDDMDVVFDEEQKEIIISASKGDNAKSWKFFLPVVIDMGVYRETDDYIRGDGVTAGGSFWIAQRKVEFGEKPGNSEAWRLAVKKGRDGRDRPVEPITPPTSVKLEE